MRPTDVTTGEVRLSYVHVFQPYAMDASSDPKYSVTVLVPKTDQKTLAAMQAAIHAAEEQGKAGKWGGQAPAKVPNPVHDGDGLKTNGEEYGPECKGHYVFTATCRQDYPPKVVDLRLQPIIDSTEVYSGCYGRVNVSFFPYSYNGRKGVGVALNHVQKTKDGEPLGGSAPSVSDAFGAPVEVDLITGQPLEPADDNVPF